MATAEELLEEMLEKQLEHLRAKQGSERERQLEERLAVLEKRLAAKPDDEVEEAIEELDDDEWELIKQHRASKTAPNPKPDDPDEPDEPEEEKTEARKIRPGRKSGMAYKWDVDDNNKVRRLDIATIYHGPDEPDEVELEPREEVA